jgi:hypothetical protein
VSKQEVKENKFSSALKEMHRESREDAAIKDLHNGNHKERNKAKRRRKL